MERNTIKNSLNRFLNSENFSAKTTKIILAVLLVAGTLTLSLMAPNVIQIFGKYKCARKRSAQNLRQAIHRLKKQKMIEVIKENDDSLTIRLTQNGKRKIKKLSIDNLKISKPRHWDKKWHIVIFDIPNKYVRARDALRLKLRDLEFYQLQKSVWIYPFPCENEILFVAEVFGVQRFIELLTVEKLLHEEKIKNYFKLT